MYRTNHHTAPKPSIKPINLPGPPKLKPLDKMIGALIALFLVLSAGLVYNCQQSTHGCAEEVEHNHYASPPAGIDKKVENISE